MLWRDFRWGALVLGCTVALVLLARSGDPALGKGKRSKKSARARRRR